VSSPCCPRSWPRPLPGRETGALLLLGALLAAVDLLHRAASCFLSEGDAGGRAGGPSSGGGGGGGARHARARGVRSDNGEAGNRQESKRAVVCGARGTRHSRRALARRRPAAGAGRAGRVATTRPRQQRGGGPPERDEGGPARARARARALQRPPMSGLRIVRARAHIEKRDGGAALRPPLCPFAPGTRGPRRRRLVCRPCSRRIKKDTRRPAIVYITSSGRGGGGGGGPSGCRPLVAFSGGGPPPPPPPPPPPTQPPAPGRRERRRRGANNGGGQGAPLHRKARPTFTLSQHPPPTRQL